MHSSLRALVVSAVLVGFPIPGSAQDDFLTRGEVEEVRDAQEAGKRIELYLEIAQRRLDAVQTGVASTKAGTGRAIQESLEEYTLILEAIETTVDDGREKRSLREKDLEEAEEIEVGFLTYLQSIDSEQSPWYEDYQFTLEEAIAVTEEILASAREGVYPEIEGREPRPFPTARPPERMPRREPPPLPEDGPPRRRRR